MTTVVRFRSGWVESHAASLHLPRRCWSVTGIACSIIVGDNTSGLKMHRVDEVVDLSSNSVCLLLLRSSFDSRASIFARKPLSKWRFVLAALPQRRMSATGVLCSVVPECLQPLHTQQLLTTINPPIMLSAFDQIDCIDVSPSFWSPYGVRPADTKSSANHRLQAHRPLELNAH